MCACGIWSSTVAVCVFVSTFASERVTSEMHYSTTMSHSVTTTKTAATTATTATDAVAGSTHACRAGNLGMLLLVLLLLMLFELKM